MVCTLFHNERATLNRLAGPLLSANILRMGCQQRKSQCVLELSSGVYAQPIVRDGDLGLHLFAELTCQSCGAVISGGCSGNGEGLSFDIRWKVPRSTIGVFCRGYWERLTRASLGVWLQEAMCRRQSCQDVSQTCYPSKTWLSYTVPRLWSCGISKDSDGVRRMASNVWAFQSKTWISASPDRADQCSGRDENCMNLTRYQSKQ